MVFLKRGKEGNGGANVGSSNLVILTIHGEEDSVVVAFVGL